MADPNFPPNLDIHPLVFPNSSNDGDDSVQQAAAIERFGIAGRVWEAGRPLIEYFTPGNSYQPPCSLFGHGPHRVIELGSGQALSSLYLASQLEKGDSVILSDLPNVVPLCENAVERWKSRLSDRAEVMVVPLAWGQSVDHLRYLFPFTHVLVCDLVYFPHLYPPLLLTLLELTEPTTLPTNELFGPEVIVSYHSRTLALEESFFQSFSLYFRMEPIYGGNQETKMYTCRRWGVNERWLLPTTECVMNGSSSVMRGRTFELVDQMLGSISV